MMRISAFADEISDDLGQQMYHLKKNGIGFIELRGVWGKNVLALSEEEVREVRQQADGEGLGLSAVGSPLGKFPIDGDFEDQMEGLKWALEIAQMLDAPYIRMFSFWMPPGEDPAAHRTQVMDWLGKMIAEAEKTPIILAHENEKGIYGDTAQRCLDLYSNLRSPAFTGVFDFANYLQCEQRPALDCWPLLKEHITYFHIKDARLDSGQVVPAGEGDGDLEQVLRDAFQNGFSNFVTLEPHLSVAAASYGRTTPELFETAVRALHRILR